MSGVPAYGGHLPRGLAGWRVRPLWSVYTRRKDTGYPDEPFLSVSRDRGVYVKADGDPAAEDRSVYQLVEPGWLVVNRMQAWRGAVAVSNDRGIVSGHYICFEPNHSEDSRYIGYLLRSAPYVTAFAVMSRGVRPGQAEVDNELLGSLPLLLPPADEQRRIADFLDDQTARIDKVIMRRRRQQRLIAELLSSSIDERATTAEVELRRVVSRWIDYRGATPRKVLEGIPLVTAANVRNGEIRFDSTKECVDADGYDEWMRRGLPVIGDVLLTTEAPLGEVAQVHDTNIALAQRIILLRPDASLCLPRWLYWALMSPAFQGSLEANATGTTARGIKADRLRGLRVPLPPLSVQVSHVRGLDVVLDQVRESERQMVRQVEALMEFKQSLVSAAVAGEFDVASASGRGVPAWTGC